ncbi:MAG: phosphate ABC transporter substrate-binding protein PstS [Actinobacteria bacterium]|nr:phosphate ABC transporter substrate-binding protein PstS [Actinomycetota bacterium]
MPSSTARTRAATALGIAAVVAAVLGATIGSPAAPASASAVVRAAGSTWSQNAIDQWRADVARFGLQINYQGVGSSAGRQFFLANQVDFAVSEIPFQPNERPSVSFVYLPIVAGGTSFMYNLTDAAGARVTNLRLSSRTLVGIFTGTITNWADPAITADNAGRVLPDRAITPVIRSDGSGTSAQFSAWLARTQPSEWTTFARTYSIPPTFTSNWPVFTGAVAQSGSDGVAQYVSDGGKGPGSITYVETSYAIERRFPVAAVRNQSGAYTVPTARNVAIALTRARLNADRTQVLDDVYTNPDPNAYPVSSYSYMIAKTSGISPGVGADVAKFVYYFACAGQQKAEPLGYSPLPPNLVRAAFDAISQVPGAPAPPAVTPVECRNPTVIGTGPLPGDSGPTVPGGGGSGGGGGGGGGGGSGGGGSGGSGAGGTGGSGSGGAGSGPGPGGGAGAGGTGATGTRGAPGAGGSAAGGNTGDPLADQAAGTALPGDGGSALAAPTSAVAVRGDRGSAVPLVAAAAVLLGALAVPPLLAGLASTPPGALRRRRLRDRLGRRR